MKKIIFFYIIVFSIIFSSCYPQSKDINQEKDIQISDEKEIEHEKNTEETLDKISLNELKQSVFNMNNNLVLNINDDALKIIVDGNIIIPEVIELPVYKTEPVRFTYESLKTLTTYLCGDNPVYYVASGQETSFSKKELKNIIDTLTNIEQASEISNKNREMLVEEISLMKAFYKQSDLIEEELYSSKSLSQPLEEIYLKSYLGNEIAAKLRVNSSTHDYYSVSFANRGYEVAQKYYSDITLNQPQSDDFNNRKDIALELINTLNSSDNNFKICEVGLAYYDYYYYRFEENEINLEYVFVLCREIDNHLLSRNNQLFRGNKIVPETITVCVGENGVNAFNWMHFMDYERQKNDSNDYVDFNVIANTFSENCVDIIEQSLAEIRLNSNNLTFNVNNIRLEYTLINVRGENLFIPSWNFYADIISDDESDISDSDTSSWMNNISIMSISALDGTVLY